MSDWFCLKCKILWLGRARPKHKAYCDGIVVDATGRNPAPDRVSQTFCAQPVCEPCKDTGLVVIEHEAGCAGDTSLGDCCYYDESYCRCVVGRALKKKES